MVVRFGATRIYIFRIISFHFDERVSVAINREYSNRFAKPCR
ncbi:hypothetical protein Plhal304r1_c026g0086611 [Plasmopara halstedii]